MDAAALERILAEHKKWRESDGREGTRADLSGADLTEAKLSGAVFASGWIIRKKED